MDIDRWQGAAASNTATVPDGAPTGWLGASVNDVVRELMAAVKRRFEVDDWRNPFLNSSGAERFTFTRISNTQFQVNGVDATLTLPVGKRIQLVGATTVAGFVTAVSFAASNTTVTVAWDAGADVNLGAPGSTTFAADNTITATNAIFGAVVVGDVVVPVGGGSQNFGTLTVSGITSSVKITVSNTLRAEVVTPSSFLLVNASGQTTPTSPSSLRVAGSHTPSRGAYVPLSGNTGLLRRFDVQNYALIKTEKNLAPALSDDSDKVDGFHAEDLWTGVAKDVILTADQQFTDNAEHNLTELTNIPISNANGSRVFRLDSRIGVIVSGVGSAITFRYRVGPLGTIADPVLGLLNYTIPNGGSLRVDVIGPRITPASGDKVTFTSQATNLVTTYKAASGTDVTLQSRLEIKRVS